METQDKRFNKLPMWAKQRMEYMDGLIRSLQTKVDQMNGDAATNTFIRNGLERQNLPKGSVIEFFTDENLLNKASIYVKNDGTIDVNTDSRLGLDMFISPSAANSFKIVFK